MSTAKEKTPPVPQQLQAVPTKAEAPITVMDGFAITKKWVLNVGLDNLPEKFVRQHEDKLVEIAKALAEQDAKDWKWRANLLFSASNPVLAYKDSLRNAYKSLPQDLMAEHSDLIIEIARLEPNHPEMIYEKLPKDLVKQHPEEIMRIIKAAGDSAAQIMVWLNSEMDTIMKHVDAFERICAAGGASSLAMNKDFFKEYFDGHADLLAGLVERAGRATQTIFRYMPAGLTDEQFEKAAELLGLIADTPKPPYISSEEDLYRYEPGKYEFMLSYFYKNKFGRLPPETEIFDKKMWTRKHYENTDLFYKSIIKGLASTDDFNKAYYAPLAKSCMKLMAKCNEEFGITRFERYSVSYILERNIANLDPKHEQGKPVAIIIHNKADWNAAFGSESYIRQLERLSKYYRVVCYETDTEEGLFSAFDKASAYGKIGLVVLGGHGTQIALELGDTQKRDSIKKREDLGEDETKYLDITDEEQLKKIDQYLTPDAKAVLASCSTGEGKVLADNLANSVSRAFSGKEVFAPIEPNSVPAIYFDLDDKGKLKAVDFKGVETYVARRPRPQFTKISGIPIENLPDNPYEYDTESVTKATPAKKVAEKKKEA